MRWKKERNEYIKRRIKRDEGKKEMSTSKGEEKEMKERKKWVHQKENKKRWKKERNEYIKRRIKRDEGKKEMSTSKGE